MPRFIEFKSCCALIKWWGFACRMYKVPEQLLFHVPNQAAGGPRRGANLKAMGVRAGTPDYMLAVPRKGVHGLFMEMKAPDGKVTEEQEIALHKLREQGYATEVCYSTDAARNAIELYLKS